MENNTTIWFDDFYLYYKDELGHTYNFSLELFPSLLKASKKERLEFEVSPFGVHWPKLDEDLSFEGFKQHIKLAHH